MRDFKSFLEKKLDIESTYLDPKRKSGYEYQRLPFPKRDPIFKEVKFKFDVAPTGMSHRKLYISEPNDGLIDDLLLYLKDNDVTWDGSNLGVSEQRKSLSKLLTSYFYVDRNRVNFNRIHVSGGIPSFTWGLGIGYALYKSLIEELGWASSNKDSSENAQSVWRKLSKDNDLTGIILENSNNEGSILLFDKKWGGNFSEVIDEFIKFNEPIKIQFDTWLKNKIKI